MSVNIGKMGNFGKSSWNSKRTQYVEITSSEIGMVTQ